MYLNGRQDGVCAAGTQWYVCNSNGFRGCCSVDACNLSTCPDGLAKQLELRSTLTIPGPAPTSASSTSTKPLPTTTPTSTGIYTVTLEPSSAPTATAVGTNNAATTSPSSSPKIPAIVGGTIGGVVFLIIAGFAIWFFWRRWREQRILLTSRGMTPMLGSHGNEKFAMDQSPDPDSGDLRGNGGMFAPFGGYRQTPSVDEHDHEREAQQVSRSLEIDEEQGQDHPIQDGEKTSLVAPPENEHPAYHPLPGKHLPAYIPGQPTYNSLPSQRGYQGQERSPIPGFSHLPDQSPKIPDFAFSPIELVLGTANLGTEPLEQIPITPQAELAAFPEALSAFPMPPSAFPMPPKGTAIPSSKFSTTNASSSRSPPRSSPPRAPASESLTSKVSTAESTPQSSPPRQSSPPQQPTPPRNSAPLRKLTGLQTSSPQEIRNFITPPMNFSHKRISTPRPGYPSPTAGGKAELPASSPPPKSGSDDDLPIMSNVPVKAPLNPQPAFHHIYLPEPKSGGSESTTYSIPIGLGVESGKKKRGDERQREPSNLRQEQRRSPQPKERRERRPSESQCERRPSESQHERRPSEQQPRKEKRSSPPLQAREEMRLTPPPTTHSKRDSPPRPVGSAYATQRYSPPLKTRHRRDTSTVQPPHRPQLREQRSDISILSDFSTHHQLREQPSAVSTLSALSHPLREQTSAVSGLSIMTEEPERIHDNGEHDPTLRSASALKHNHSREWSASEKDHVTSWQVYKGETPLLGHAGEYDNQDLGLDDVVSPLFSPQSAAKGRSEWAEGDLSVQPLNLEGRQDYFSANPKGKRVPEGWSAVPLTPMTPREQQMLQQRTLRHKNERLREEGRSGRV